MPIIADNTGGERPGVLAHAIDGINTIRPDFVIGIGDLIEGGEKTLEATREQWAHVDKAIGKLDVPFIPIPGNHDYNSKSTAEKDAWKERYGATYRSFLHEDMLFLLLNSEEAGYGKFGEKQINFALKTLEENKNVRWTFIFMHQPNWRTHRNREWRTLENALRDRPHTAFSGHTHYYELNLINSWQYITLASTGGTVSSGKHDNRPTAKDGYAENHVA